MVRRVALVLLAATVTACGLIEPPDSEVFREVEYRLVQAEESTAETPRPQESRVWFVLANGETAERVVRSPWALSMRDSVGDSLAIASRGDYEKEGDEFELAIVVEGEVVARGEYFADENVTVAEAGIPD